MIASHWDIIAECGVWLAVNAIVVGLWYCENHTEHKYYQFLSHAAQKARDARTKGLKDEERGRISKTIRDEAKPMIEDLRLTASSSDPVRQHLLSAARDHLAKLFGETGADVEREDRIFEEHLYEAGLGLGLDVRPPARSHVRDGARTFHRG